MASAIIKSVFFSLFGAFLALTPLLSYASVAINEVLFNPSGDDRGLELIEIYNSGDSEEDLSGWQVYPDGIGYFSFPSGFKLGPKDFVTLHLRAFGTNSAGDFYFSEASGNMGNTSGSVALFSGTPRGKNTIKSFVQWGRAGETWETDAEEAGLWTKGAYINLTNFNEGNSIGLIQDGVSGGADSWKIFNSPTAGLSNNNSGSSSNQLTAPQSTSPSVSANPNSSYTIADWPVIKVFAGDDKIVAAGAITEFNGSAFGDKNEPLDNARFWWNFGDGASKEGRIVNHIFDSFGDYTVGLHVSSGGFSASDYLKVSVAQNKLTISGVLTGDGGFIKLNNSGEEEIDIGGWVIEDNANKIFVIPYKTKIGAKSEIAFTNGITGLLRDKFSLPLTVKYPSGALALSWSQSIAPKPIIESLSAENQNSVSPETPSAKSDEESQVSQGEADNEKNLSKTAFAGQSDKWLFFASAVGFGVLAALYFLFAKKFHNNG